MNCHVPRLPLLGDEIDRPSLRDESVFSVELTVCGRSSNCSELWASSPLTLKAAKPGNDANIPSPIPTSFVHMLTVVSAKNTKPIALQR